MKFLRSEGRVICLVEEEDILNTPIATGRSLPSIHLLLVPAHLQETIQASHIWQPLMQSIGTRTQNIIYW